MRHVQVEKSGIAESEPQARTIPGWPSALKSLLTQWQYIANEVYLRRSYG